MTNVVIPVMADDASDIETFIVCDMTDVTVITMVGMSGISVFSISINIMVEVTYRMVVMICVLYDISCNIGWVVIAVIVVVTTEVTRNACPALTPLVMLTTIVVSYLSVWFVYPLVLVLDTLV